MVREEIINHITDLLLLINIILYIKCFSKKRKTLNIFVFYLIYIGLIQLVSTIIFNTGESNLYLSHFYFVGQFLFLSFLYKKLLKNNFHKKIISSISIIVCVILIIQYIISPELFYSFNLFEIIISSTPIIFYSVLFFFQSIENINKQFIYINSGIFIYISSSTLLFSAGNFINSSPSLFKKIVWEINMILYIIYLLLIFVEWYKHFRKSAIAK
jgi:hypothetical protein